MYTLLLIVPYGIETAIRLAGKHSQKELLIVPYGIETRILQSTKMSLKVLLIVPYGIETPSDAESDGREIDF